MADDNVSCPQPDGRHCAGWADGWGRGGWAGGMGFGRTVIGCRRKLILNVC